jgi:hypothetical protein
MARTGLQPRISNLLMRAVPSPEGGYVIVVRIPRSYTQPHRVIHSNSNRFWARSSASPKRYEPNVEELRRIFNDVPSIADRIRAFRTDRLVKITAGETPIPLSKIGKVVIHVVPLPSFADGRLADVVSAVATGTHVPLPLDEIGYGNRTGVNLDGFINYTYGHAGARLAYAQFFRNGAIEGVGELRHEDGDDKTRFVGRDFTTLVITAVRRYLGDLKSYDTGLPIFIFLSLCNAAKTVYRYSPEGLAWTDTPPLGREIATFPEIYVESFDIDVPTTMRSVFNMVWNAFGLFQCDMYDGQGNWRGERQTIS